MTDDKIVRLVPRQESEDDEPLLSDDAKERGIAHLRELIERIEKNEVSAVFCCVTYGDTGTGGFRFGDQNLELLGFVDWFKFHMMEGMQ